MTTHTVHFQYFSKIYHDDISRNMKTLIPVLTIVWQIRLLHCYGTRCDRWQPRSVPVPWVEYCRLMYRENTRAEFLSSTHDRQTGHRCCHVTYECRPLRPQRSTAWRKTHTCPRYSDWRSECLSSEQNYSLLSVQSTFIIITLWWLDSGERCRHGYFIAITLGVFYQLLASITAQCSNQHHSTYLAQCSWPSSCIPFNHCAPAQGGKWVTSLYGLSFAQSFARSKIRTERKLRQKLKWIFCFDSVRTSDWAKDWAKD